MKPIKWLAQGVGKLALRGRKAARPRNAEKDRAAIRNSLASKLPAHLVRDVGGSQ